MTVCCCFNALSVELLMCLIEAFRRLHDDDSPLLLNLTWSEEYEAGLDLKQFVLKEKHTDVIEVRYCLSRIYLL